MVAINRRKKKGSSKNRNVALLAKLTLAAAFIWTITTFLFSGLSGPDTPTLINKIKEKSLTNYAVGNGDVTGSDEEVIGSVRGGSNGEQMKVDHTHHPIQPRKTDSVPKVKTNPDIKVEPLRATNREIISTAPSVDIAFVDIANDNEEDPHRGAKDEDGNFGYRHDETALKNNPPAFKITKAEAKCDNHDGNYRMLTSKVFVDIASHEAREREAEHDGGKPRAKIFCMAYTIQKNHGKLPAIRETWGQKCDGFMVASDKTDKELGTVNIPHEGPEEYNNIWQKVRSMWSYVYDNYYQDYDWFHIGGDDLYVIVENLRLYVESNEVQLAANGGETLPNGDESHQTPLFLGRRFAEQGNHKRIFNSGGSGYTMNKAALKSLVVDAFPTCMPHMKTFAEDVMIAQCLRNKIRVVPFDTKDDEGGERYMPFQPMHHLNYKPPKDKKDDWYANYSIDIKFGLDHCSSQSVAFHYIKPELMRRMHAILYGHCA